MHADARKRRVFAVRYGRARAKSITITLASGEALRYITLGIAVAVAYRTHAQSSLPSMIAVTAFASTMSILQWLITGTATL